MKKTKAAVVPDLGLHRLVEQWDESLRIANASWATIARHVRDHNVSRPTLFYALVHVHGMKESSAHVECTRFLRFTKSRAASNALDRALNGDESISVSKLKDVSITQRRIGARKSVSQKLALDEEAIDRGLAKLARDAVKHGTRDAKTFLAAAKVAFQLAASRGAQDNVVEGP